MVRGSIDSHCTMKKYELTKEYLTGIDMIDKEHGKLFDLAN